MKRPTTKTKSNGNGFSNNGIGPYDGTALSAALNHDNAVAGWDQIQKSLNANFEAERVHRFRNNGL